MSVPDKFDDPVNQDLTRRQWVLRLGELVALAGVSGVVPEFATSLVTQHSSNPLLPRGLYEPSQNHLVHALSSGGKHWTPPAGSETDYVIPNSTPYQPQFFSADEFQVAARLLEILLGKIEPAALSQSVQWLDLYLSTISGVRTAAQNLAPMHRILAVEFFGEDSLHELESADTESIARTGLRALESLSKQNYGQAFLRLDESQQIQIIAQAEKSGPESDLRKLYELARTEGIRGYYTSAEGLKELNYRGNAYYGDSPGCEPKS